MRGFGHGVKSVSCLCVIGMGEPGRVPGAACEQSSMTTRPAAASEFHRAVIIGAGAVGAHLAACLRPGTGLVVIDPDPRVGAAFVARGIPHAAAVGVGPGVQRPGDVAILATSAARAGTIAAALPSDLPIVCVANGLDLGIDPRRPAGLSFGVVEFAASSPAPGHARCTRPGWLTLDGGSASATWLAAAIDPGRQRTRLVPDLIAHRRSKLMLNASLDPVAAVIGGTLGDVFRGRESFAAFRALLAESLAVADASGWTLVAVQGMSPAGMRRVFGTPVLSAIASTIAGVQARSVQSTLAREIARGELGEADQLSGAIMRQGATVGVATPAHTRVLEVLGRLARAGGGGRPALASELMR